MSKPDLQKDELELLASYEAEEWKSAKKAKEQKEQYRAYARATLRKDKRVNIRISERDLLALQRHAVRQACICALIDQTYSSNRKDDLPVG